VITKIFGIFVVSSIAIERVTGVELVEMFMIGSL